MLNNKKNLFFRNFDLSRYYDQAFQNQQEIMNSPAIKGFQERLLNSIYSSFSDPTFQQGCGGNCFQQQAPARSPQPQQQNSQLQQLNPYYRGYKVANNPYAPYVRRGQLKRY